MKQVITECNDPDSYKKWKIQDYRNRFVSARKSMVGRTLLLFFVQLLLSVFMMKEALNGETFDNIKQYPSSLELVMTRFLCAVFLHISLGDELRQSFALMKYA